MQVEGKTYYQLSEAVDELGYTESTIRSYISGGIIEAQKLPDGECVLTEAGMVALRRRKNTVRGGPAPCIIKKAPSQTSPDPIPEPDHIVEVNKKIEPKTKTKEHQEGSLYIRSEKHARSYQILKDTAGMLGIPVGDLTMQILDSYVDDKIQPKLADLQKLKEQEKAILAGLL